MSLEEVREKYIILLLGVDSKPLPSLWHLQKEFFVLVQTFPKFNKYFKFEKHYNGPYCVEIKDAVEDPFVYSDAYVYQHNEIILTIKGKKIFNELVTKYANKTDFIILKKSMMLIRELYDTLTRDELLFLIYQTYPEYADASNVYDRLVANESNRIRIAKSLLRKGAITEERYYEVLNCPK